MILPLLMLISIALEHATTLEERQHGLMGRKELHSGMLFHFDENKRHAVWAMNCEIPLSVAFINEEGEIVEIGDLEAYPDFQGSREERRSFFLSHALYPKNPSKYLLEVPKGWFEMHAIEVGDHFSWEGEWGFFSKKKAL